MSYISLYRKWRSQNFDEVVGQPAIVQTLKNAIKNNRLAHAYLFSGPRGTGKTSTARILAKALNCEKRPTPNPCGKCSQCEKITSGHSVNVIEIDAASNRGIDEIRELRERIRYAPVEGRYKVYIIDEVHMLTSEAFNALLKTLEEPPSHTIFVLATTELHKVPLTISSRCQRLDFGRIKLSEIEAHLKAVAKKEGFEIDDKALNLIARMAEGAMRDAISLLDQLVSFSGHKISYDDVVMMMGTADEELLFSFADAVAGNDSAKVLELIGKGLEEGRSTAQVTRDLVSHFRNLLHLKVGSGEALELTHDYLKRLKVQAEIFSLNKIKDVIRALSRAELDMKWHPHGRLVLEVALLELLGERSAEAEVKRETKVEARKADAPRISQNDSPIASGGRITRVKTHWKDILENVRKKSIFSYVSLHEGEPVEVNDKGKLVISFRRGYAFHKERLEEVKNKLSVEDAIQEVVGEKVPIECIVSNGKKEPALSANTVAEFFEGRVLT
ncbi:MAG: DNA polymerase III subunit gamma/tau [Candidatus Margulisiibacteriota bacterium]|nr:DNA polymerase III subunit gamma/tau [Candidatus Margulisiibacteriota bacterium]